MKRRLGGQFDFQGKKQKLEQMITRDNNGEVWIVDNSEGVDSSRNIEKTFEEIVSQLGIK